ncbi:MAG: site-2 protease family protein [Caldilineaceae bacterium]
MLTTILGFTIVLGILVFFHELGHYWVARRNGIVVEEFGMGYPPLGEAFLPTTAPTSR